MKRTRIFLLQYTEGNSPDESGMTAIELEDGTFKIKAVDPYEAMDILKIISKDKEGVEDED